MTDNGEKYLRLFQDTEDQTLKDLWDSFLKTANIKQLQSVVREFNLHTKIKGYAKMKRDVLIKELSKRLDIDKNDKFVYKTAEPLKFSKVDLVKEKSKQDKLPKPTILTQKQSVSPVVKPKKVKRKLKLVDTGVSPVVEAPKGKDFTKTTLYQNIDYNDNAGDIIADYERDWIDNILNNKEDYFSKKTLRTKDEEDLFNMAIDWVLNKMKPLLKQVYSRFYDANKGFKTLTIPEINVYWSKLFTDIPKTRKGRIQDVSDLFDNKIDTRGYVIGNIGEVIPATQEELDKEAKEAREEARREAERDRQRAERRRVEDQARQQREEAEQMRNVERVRQREIDETMKKDEFVKRFNALQTKIKENEDVLRLYVKDFSIDADYENGTEMDIKINKRSYFEYYNKMLNDANRFDELDKVERQLNHFLSVLEDDPDKVEENQVLVTDEYAKAYKKAVELMRKTQGRNIKTGEMLKTKPKKGKNTFNKSITKGVSGADAPVGGYVGGAIEKLNLLSLGELKKLAKKYNSFLPNINSTKMNKKDLVIILGERLELNENGDFITKVIEPTNLQSVNVKDRKAYTKKTINMKGKVVPFICENEVILTAYDMVMKDNKSVCYFKTNLDDFKTIYEKYVECKKQKKILVFPFINETLENDSYIVMVAINPKTKTIELFDPIGKTEKISIKYLQELLEYFNKTFYEKVNPKDKTFYEKVKMSLVVADRFCRVIQTKAFETKEAYCCFLNIFFMSIRLQFPTTELKELYKSLNEMIDTEIKPILDDFIDKYIEYFNFVFGSFDDKEGGNILQKLSELNVKELKSLAKQYNNDIPVKNFTKLTRADLIEKIVERLIIKDGEILHRNIPEMTGSGIFDYFKRLFDPYMYNRNSTDVLNKYGNNKIKYLQINRTPIYNSINKALDLISLGKWSELKTKYSYDDMFHLSLVATIITDDGKYKKILLEKNEQINITENVKIYDTTETQLIKPSPSKNLTLNSMLSKTLERIGKENFFIYSAFKNNCQHFIKSILISNRLYNVKLDKFVYQNIVDLVAELPSYVPTTANAITGLASWLKRLTGAGKETPL